MTISEVLESVRFVVDRAGKPTAAVVDIEAWESFVQALEDLEDNHLLRERLAGWESKEGWVRWEEFKDAPSPSRSLARDLCRG